MAKTAADVLIETIHDWGVDVVFGIPGDGINGLMESLRTHQDTVRFIQVRHEEAAAFMATSYAKHTGKLGVCLATSGPGGIHLLNGLYDAKMDGAPVLALTGMQFHDLACTHSQQDVELDKLFENVCVYNARVMGPAHVENVADLACRTALAYRGVAHITFPIDFQALEAAPRARDVRSPRNIKNRGSHVFARPAQVPSDDDLARAAEVVNAGRKIAILAGRGALQATNELIQLAEKLQAPIIKALLGKASVPDESIYTTGGIGLLGTLPSQKALEECDTLIIAGTSFPYIEFLPHPGQARAIQIDLDPARIGIRMPVDVGLIGDTGRTIKALLPFLQWNDHRDFLNQAQTGMKNWWALMKEQGSSLAKPMKPQVVAWNLGERLREDAMVCCDSGTIATWWARQIPVRRGQSHTISGTLASMACGLPYAIAAQIAYPSRQSVAFVGDGGFSMLMAEFATCVKYRLPVKVIVIKNNTLGMIKWEQMVFEGNPEYGCDLQPIDFAKFADAAGGRGFTIDDPATCGDILEEALETPGPVLVQAVVDPLEAPLPGKVRFGQARNFARSLIRGEPDGAKIALGIFSEKLREIF